MLNEEYIKINNELKQNLASEKGINDVILHHYTSAEGLKGILKDSEIWFSNTRFLNDSSENNYIYDMFPRRYDEYEQSLDLEFYSQLDKIANDFLNKDYCNINNKRLWADDIYVASFSLERDNLPLWNYYCHAANCVGYNITFEKAPFEISNISYSFISGKVIYKESEQYRLLKDIILKYNNLYVKNKEKFSADVNLKYDFYKHFVDIIELYNIFFKNKAFGIEKEYRYAIYNIRNPRNVKWGYNIKNGYFIPHLKIKFLNDKIRQIGISPTENKDFVKRGTEMFLQIENCNSRIKVWASDIPQRY